MSRKEISYERNFVRSSIYRVPSFRLTNIIDSSDWNFNRVNAPVPCTIYFVARFKDSERVSDIERETKFSECGETRITNSWDDEAGTNRV